MRIHSKIIVPLLFALAFASATRAAGIDSRWKYYGAYHNSLACIVADDAVFSLCDGSIYSYSPSDGEARAYDKTTGMSAAGIITMAYSRERKCFALLYDDYNIDVFFPATEKLSNMPQFKNSSADKNVNDFTVCGSNAYIATNTGITVVDLKRLEFGKTYNMGVVVSSAVSIGSKIYAATPSGMLVGDTGDNLLDPSAWQKLNGGGFAKLRVLGDRIYAMTQWGSIFSVDPSSSNFEVFDPSVSTFMCSDNGQQLFYGNAKAAYQVESDGVAKKIAGSNNFKYITASGSTYWAACGFGGTQRMKLSGDGQLVADGTPLALNSPIRNHCAFMNFTPSGRLLVAGGIFSYTGLNYDGTLYTMKDGKFTNFEDSISLHTGYRYRNLTGAVEDPADPSHVFASSAETGLYEFRDGKYVAHYDNKNSTLASAVPGDTYDYLYVRTAAPQFDPDGNLWMLNDEVDTIVKIRMKDGKWRSLYISELAGYPTFDHMIFDDAGRAWFTHRRTTSKHFAGVACLDYGGTPADASDDKFTFRYRFTNEDGTTYTPNTVDAIAKDNNGSIWVGTIEGPFLIENPDEFSATDFRFEQVKVPRNDGTDYADYLLTGVPITAIAVDEANRKWFGTRGDGIYLISSDNITTLAHYTSANSPLVSDVVYSLAVDKSTGLLMIGTDKGLMSLEPSKQNPSGKLKDDDLHIYPNPVRPDYYGDVTIEGLPDGAEVKITTTGGQLVRKAKTTGGVYKWDVRDASGAGVGSGVYYVLAVTADGKHGARGRIVVVR